MSATDSREPLGRLRQQLDRAGWLVREVARAGWPSLAVRFDGGLGDDLMLSAVFREWRSRGRRGLWVLTNAPELFAGNGDVDHVLPCSEESVVALRRVGVPVAHCHYHRYDAELDRDEAPREHYIAAMCRGAGLAGEVRLRPYLSLTESERQQGRIAPDQVVVQTSAQGARFPIPNKEWPAAHFGRLIERLIQRFRVVQLGSAQDPTFPGVMDLRGRTSVREAAAVLAGSRVFVGLPGFLMHLARAVETPSVVVFGGREDPAISGYAEFENLVSRMGCAPCWRRRTCPYDRKCLSEIQPAEVCEAIERAIERGNQPLAFSTTHLCAMISVCLCTHNPAPVVLERTVTALAAQRIRTSEWELKVIDNASTPPVNPEVFRSLRGILTVDVVREETLGLTHARRKALEAANGEFLVFVDDDNVLGNGYLAAVLEFFESHAMAGAVGGRGVARSDAVLPEWFDLVSEALAVRDLGEQPIRFERDAPCGAGLAVRREALVEAFGWPPLLLTDRQGARLSSGGDTELCRRMQLSGWELWYAPSLRFDHWLAPGRFEIPYLETLHEGFGEARACMELYDSPDLGNRRLLSLRRARYEGSRSRALESEAAKAAGIRQRLSLTFQAAFARGLSRSLKRVAFGPAVWESLSERWGGA